MTIPDREHQAVATILARTGPTPGYINDPAAGEAEARRGLIRMAALLATLGDPHRAFAVIHVAGSKGKGSTCAFAAAMLCAAGIRAGRYLSPHLHSWRERIVVDGNMIPPNAFAALVAEVDAAATDLERRRPDLGRTTAFELLTAMALAWFARCGCRVAVIETGLGGTLDATNVVDPAAAAITPLDLEHTAILGDTLAEIAANKAGIITPGRPAVTAAQPEEGLRVIAARAASVGAPLLVAGRDWRTEGTDRAFSAIGPWGALDGLQLAMPGGHQVENAGLAIAALHAAGDALGDVASSQRDAGVGIVPEAAVRAGLLAARLPGRFERVATPEGPPVVIDGAHTPRATMALADALREHHPNARIAMVVGMLRGRDPAMVLRPLAPLAHRWVAVAPATPRAIPAGDIARAMAAVGGEAVAAERVEFGVALARSMDVNLVVVTGSLATAAEARKALGLA